MCIYFLENIKCINFILYSIQTGIVPVLVTATFISLKLFIMILLFFRKPTRPSLPLRKETFESFRLPLDKISYTRQFESELSLHSLASLFPIKKGFFLPLRLSCKESSTFLTKPLFPQEREDVTALRCSEPLRYKVGGASKPSPCFAGWDRRKTEYLYNELTVKILISTYNILKYQNAILLNFRLVSIFLTYSLET